MDELQLPEPREPDPGIYGCLGAVLNDRGIARVAITHYRDRRDRRDATLDEAVAEIWSELHWMYREGKLAHALSYKPAGLSDREWVLRRYGEDLDWARGAPAG